MFNALDIRPHVHNPTFSECGGTTSAVHYSGECTDPENGEKRYYSDGPYPSYSHVLDSAILFHRDYLDMYSSDSEKMRRAREYVDSVRNCEDFVFPMVAEHIKMPAIAVDTYDRTARESCVQHLQLEAAKGHHGGLNRIPGHLKTRTKCLNDLSGIFGNM